MAALLLRLQAQFQGRRRRLQLCRLHFRTNSDLVGKYVNIASRSAGFLVKRFEGRVSDPAIAESSLIAEIKAAAPDINASFEGREYGKALPRRDGACQQSQRIRRPKQPWELAKQPERAAELHAVCSVTLEAFRLLTLFLKPVLPRTAENVETFLNCGELTWNSVDNALSSDKPINPFKHLMKRVDENKFSSSSN